MALKWIEKGPKLGGPTKSMVFFFHGFGTDAGDLMSLADQWEEALPDTTFVGLNAPEICEINPDGFQWFKMLGMMPATFLLAIRQVWPEVESTIKVIRDRVKGECPVAFVGFSQGAMVALYAHLHCKQLPLAGTLAYAGALVSEDYLEQGANTQAPIMLIHGEQDPIIPVGNCYFAKEKLKSFGYSAEQLQIPHLGHNIDSLGIQKGIAFLENVLRGSRPLNNESE